MEDGMKEILILHVANELLEKTLPAQHHQFGCGRFSIHLDYNREIFHF